MSRALFGAVLAVVAAPQCARAQAPGADAAQPLGQPLAQRSPANVYASTCGYCHGHNVGPVILGRKLPAEMVKMMVRSGPHGMPAFRPSEISEAELAALALWVQKSPAQSGEHGK